MKKIFIMIACGICLMSLMAISFSYAQEKSVNPCNDGKVSVNCNCKNGTCSACNGSGKCWYCSGQGKHSDGSQCNQCLGTGNCSNCSGTGQIND